MADTILLLTFFRCPLLKVDCGEVSLDFLVQSPPVEALKRNIVSNLGPVYTEVTRHPQLKRTNQ